MADKKIREVVRETSTVAAVHHRESNEPAFLALQQRDQDRNTRNLALSAAMRLTEEGRSFPSWPKEGTDEDYKALKKAANDAFIEDVFALTERVFNYLTTEENSDIKEDDGNG